MGQTTSQTEDDKRKGLASDFAHHKEAAYHSQIPRRPPAQSFGPTSPPSSLTDRVRAIVSEPQSVPAAQVPITFTWVHGGSVVYLAGSFDGWQHEIPMARADSQPDAPFIRTLLLPPGVYQYKFFVDGVWRFDHLSSVTTDSKGVTNNIIEVEPFPVESMLDPYLDTAPGTLGLAAPLSQEMRRPSFSQGSDAREEHDADDEFAQSDDEYSTSAGSQYGCVAPASTASAQPPPDPPIIPPHFSEILLNSTIKQADPYLLPVPQHVTVNHLYLKSRPSGQVLILGITQRYKTKFVTTVYYKPK